MEKKNKQVIFGKVFIFGRDKEMIIDKRGVNDHKQIIYYSINNGVVLRVCNHLLDPDIE